MSLQNRVSGVAVVLAGSFLGLRSFPGADACAGAAVTQNASSHADRATLTAVMVRNFEREVSPPAVWVVNIPSDNASVRYSDDHPQEGKQCLKLHYRFVDRGAFQYLGIPSKVRIQAPVHALRFWLRGNQSGCSYGVQLADASGETHQYSKNTGQCGIIDFAGWRQVLVDLDTPHEIWGGDRNGKLDYPLAAITLTVGQPEREGRQLAAEGELSFDALGVESEKGEAETLGCRVDVLAPGYCSEVRGDTRISVTAPGLKRLTARCWKGGGRFGADSTVAAIALDAEGKGSFVFPADAYPHGPITVRIAGESGAARDRCYLQLYNKGGVAWQEGMPRDPPPAARGMKLVFADDFRGPLSISGTDPQARYYDHKPPDGYQDFSVHVFTSHGARGDPFSQVDSYLRIRASDGTRSSGLISSLKNDGHGVKASAPCYFECRFLGPSAIGTWPGFWLMTDYMTDYQRHRDKTPCDELDVIEAYGGEGPGSPNADDSYMITPHCWNQGDAGKTFETRAFQRMHNPVHMRERGIPSTWFEAFHTYGCKVTRTDTMYYCDDIDVGRHTTLPLCKEQQLFFMINLATGGGWPVDLSRYGGLADMYIDYVRVYQQSR
jgi:hypothetical protein